MATEAPEATSTPRPQSPTGLANEQYSDSSQWVKSSLLEFVQKSILNTLFHFWLCLSKPQVIHFFCFATNKNEVYKKQGLKSCYLLSLNRIQVLFPTFLNYIFDYLKCGIILSKQQKFTKKVHILFHSKYKQIHFYKRQNWPRLIFVFIK